MDCSRICAQGEMVDIPEREPFRGYMHASGAWALTWRASAGAWADFLHAGLLLHWQHLAGALAPIPFASRSAGPDKVRR